MRYCITNRRTGHELTWDRNGQEDVVLTFPSPLAAAFFIIDHNLDPSVYYWQEYIG